MSDLGDCGDCGAGMAGLFLMPPQIIAPAILLAVVAVGGILAKDGINHSMVGDELDAKIETIAENSAKTCTRAGDYPSERSGNIAARAKIDLENYRGDADFLPYSQNLEDFTTAADIDLALFQASKDYISLPLRMIFDVRVNYDGEMVAFIDNRFEDKDPVFVYGEFDRSRFDRVMAELRKEGYDSRDTLPQGIFAVIHEKGSNKDEIVFIEGAADGTIPTHNGAGTAEIGRNPCYYYGVTGAAEDLLNRGRSLIDSLKGP